ncbi:MAG: TaqI-like C-terminal specificity domain-containing protein, partial [Myxococcota bacterium]
RSAGVPLGELAEVVLGIKTGDDSRFIVEGDRPPGESYVRCVRGREVAPWQSSGPGAWLRYDPEEMRAVHGARPRRRESFERPEKLLVRETSGTRLIAAFDDKGRFPLDTLHCVLVKEGSAASLWYLLAILNSGPASFYYGLHHPGPHVKASELRALPVPPPAPCSQRERELSLQMIEWIEMCELDCSDGVSAESTAARERLKRHGEETRDDVALRTALLEELARLLTRSTEPEVRDRGSAVLDEVVAAAYGMAGDES